MAERTDEEAWRAGYDAAVQMLRVCAQVTGEGAIDRAAQVVAAQVEPAAVMDRRARGLLERAEAAARGRQLGLRNLKRTEQVLDG